MSLFLRSLLLFTPDLEGSDRAPQTIPSESSLVKQQVAWDYFQQMVTPTAAPLNSLAQDGTSHEVFTTGILCNMVGGMATTHAVLNPET